MANTTNYNWETPDDTDLVKDGAAAIRTLGSSIDTTTKNLNPETTTGDIAYRSATANTNTRLAIGSTGQVLTVAGGVPSWATPTTGDIEGVTAGTGISGGGTSGTVTITNSMATAIDAKGDLVVGTGADTFSRLAVGTNDYVLTAASGEATGLKWAAASSGGMTLISTTTLSGASTTISVAANSYKYLMAFCRNVELSDNCDVGVQINAITTSTYVNRIVGTKDSTAFNLSNEYSAIYFNLVGVDGFGDTNENNGTITFYDANSTSTGKVISAVFGGKTAGGGDFVSSSFARVQATGVISEIKFIQSGTQYDGGTVLLYGVS
jgi:hypothetical protein